MLGFLFAREQAFCSKRLKLEQSDSPVTPHFISAPYTKISEAIVNIELVVGIIKGVNEK